MGIRQDTQEYVSSMSFMIASLKSFSRSVDRLALAAALVALITLVCQPATESAPAAPATKPPASGKVADKAPTKPTPEPVIENVVNLSAEDLVNKPQEYLGKNVKFNANFFAFTSLALDYKPAFRSSKTHLSFLVLTPNTHRPLSELKLAMMIPKEKDPESNLLAALKDGDQLELIGKVFSAALDEPWVEIFKVKKLNSSADDKKVASGSESDAESDKSESKSDTKSESKSDTKSGDKGTDDKPDKPATTK